MVHCLFFTNHVIFALAYAAMESTYISIFVLNAVIAAAFYLRAEAIQGKSILEVGLQACGRD